MRPATRLTYPGGIEGCVNLGGRDGVGRNGSGIDLMLGKERIDAVLLFFQMTLTASLYTLLLGPWDWATRRGLLTLPGAVGLTVHVISYKSKSMQVSEWVQCVVQRRRTKHPFNQHKSTPST